MFNNFQAMNAAQLATKKVENIPSNKKWECRIFDTSSEKSILIGSIVKHATEKKYLVTVNATSLAPEFTTVVTNFTKAVSLFIKQFIFAAEHNAKFLCMGLTGKKLKLKGQSIMINSCDEESVNWVAFKPDGSTLPAVTKVKTFAKNWLIHNIRLEE